VVSDVHHRECFDLKERLPSTVATSSALFNPEEIQEASTPESADHTRFELVSRYALESASGVAG